MKAKEIARQLTLIESKLYQVFFFNFILFLFLFKKDIFGLII